NLTIVVAEVLKRAEGNQAQAVTGRANLTVDLEAALQLTLVVGAERTGKAPVLFDRLFDRVFGGASGASHRQSQAERGEGADKRIHRHNPFAHRSAFARPGCGSRT